MTEALRRKFIICADDYGIRQTAEPILRLAREGKVDRVAVLIHYVSEEQAKALLEMGVQIDLHLELINLVKSGEKVRESAITRGLNFGLRFLLGRVNAVSVEREWRLQIERFHLLFGRYPDGLNSHEHMHFFPSFAKVFLRLAKEFSAQYIRFGKKGMLLGPEAPIVGSVLSFLHKKIEIQFRDSGIATADYLMSFDWVRDFESFSKTLPEGSIELVIHPEREEEYRKVLDFFAVRMA
ncbi:MAG: ChbG/HpnK family deacetylase [Patescibacteria group bacterium]